MMILTTTARLSTRSTLPRAGRLVAHPPPALRGRQYRFQSSSSASSSTNSSSSSTSHFAAGVAGGVAGAAALYGVYQMTPTGRMAKKLNKAATEANAKYEQAAKKLRGTTPSSADQAIDSMKRFALSYAAFVPGGRRYVETAFDDIDKVREKHGEATDKIVNDAYKQLQEASKSGLSMETAARAWEVLADVSKKLAELAADAAGDVLDNHPQLKEKLGGNADKLKEMGQQYGPEAKKMVDETWSQVRDVVAGGLSAENLNRARRLVEEKVQQVQKLGDEAWKRGLEQVKPLLEKNTKVKELVEKNADALKQGNAKELFDKARSAVESGDMRDLEQYVSKAAEKAKSTASKASSGIGFGGVEQYLGKIPNGSEILPKLQQLGEVATKHKDEGEQLLKDTVEELGKVLEKQSKRAQEIVEKAKKESR